MLLPGICRLIPDTWRTHPHSYTNHRSPDPDSHRNPACHPDNCRAIPDSECVNGDPDQHPNFDHNPNGDQHPNRFTDAVPATNEHLYAHHPTANSNPYQYAGAAQRHLHAQQYASAAQRHLYANTQQHLRAAQRHFHGITRHTHRYGYSLIPTQRMD